MQFSQNAIGVKLKNPKKSGIFLVWQFHTNRDLQKVNFEKNPVKYSFVRPNLDISSELRDLADILLYGERCMFSAESC